MKQLKQEDTIKYSSMGRLKGSNVGELATHLSQYLTIHRINKVGEEKNEQLRKEKKKIKTTIKHNI